MHASPSGYNWPRGSFCLFCGESLTEWIHVEHLWGARHYAGRQAKALSSWSCTGRRCAHHEQIQQATPDSDTHYEVSKDAVMAVKGVFGRQGSGATLAGVIKETSLRK